MSLYNNSNQVREMFVNQKNTQIMENLLINTLGVVICKGTGTVDTACSW